MTINMLPNDVLLEIFLFLRDVKPRRDRWWRMLVQVCQRWRNLVFGSEGLLDLQLRCTDKTPVRTMLDVWPAFPIFIQQVCQCVSGEPADNILAILEHHSNRVCEIELYHLSSWLLGQIGHAMRKPFPALTDLCLCSDVFTSAIPYSFLGGSAPSLRTLTLDRVPFWAIQKLLLSATDLRYLELLGTIYSEYISPQNMVDCLSVMTTLNELVLEFETVNSVAGLTLPPQNRAILPALTSLRRFRGMCEYLEDLVARIDTPLLVNLSITIFHQRTFNTPQLLNFISRTNQLRSIRRADVVFYGHLAMVRLYPRTADSTLDLEVIENSSSWQFSPLAHLCSSFLPSIPTLERLDIRQGRSISCIASSPPPGRIENAQWLGLLRPFVAVKDLHLAGPFGLGVMSTLNEMVGERATEVLPVLQNIFSEELQPTGLKEAVGRLIAVRRLSGHTVIVHYR